MTQAEWENASDPERMLRFLRDTGMLGERKARLFAVACCRRIGHLFTHGDMARSVAVAEQFADGMAADGELRQACELAMWAGDDATRESLVAAAAGWAAAAVAHRNGGGAARDVVYEVRMAYAEDPPKQKEEQLAQCHLLRDISEPFRPQPPLDPSLLNRDGGLISRLAEAAYDERVLPLGTLDCGRLAVLADSLEEGGCTDAALLGHLRSPGPHVRGCFALDAVLGKT